MNTFAPHPGIVEMLDASTNEVERVKAETMPDDQKFVYLDARGTSINDPQKAAIRVPIVKIVTSPLNAENEIVPLEESVKMLVRYLGPGDQPLRTTTLLQG